jgi:hypothetical protein
MADDLHLNHAEFIPKFPAGMFSFRMRAILIRAATILLLALVMLYAGDWLVYRYRMAHRTAFDSVQVKQFVAVPLKDKKEEFDYIGPQQVECVRTLFPWAGDDPCWWVRRNAEKWTKV